MLDRWTIYIIRHLLAIQREGGKAEEDLKHDCKHIYLETYQTTLPRTRYREVIMRENSTKPIIT